MTLRCPWTWMALLALGSAPAHAGVHDRQARAEADRLARMQPFQIEALYRTLPPAAVPPGRVRGYALVKPGGAAAPAVSRAARVVWQGKDFHPDSTMNNRFFGLPAIPAEVGYGPSWVDGRPALILDYSRTSHLYARNRDEVRQLGPGLYLGIMHERTDCGPRATLYFLLEDACP